MPQQGEGIGLGGMGGGGLTAPSGRASRPLPENPARGEQEEGSRGPAGPGSLPVQQEGPAIPREPRGGGEGVDREGAGQLRGMIHGRW